VHAAAAAEEGAAAGGSRGERAATRTGRWGRGAGSSVQDPQAAAVRSSSPCSAGCTGTDTCLREMREIAKEKNPRRCRVLSQ
jgi:hypothetical protein